MMCMVVRVELVAERAGVSVATVSRALRAVPGVSTATRKRVQAAARELGYSASPAASRLATGQTMTVGIVVPVLAKWFFGKVIGEAAHALREAGFDVLLYELATPGQRERFFGTAQLHGRTDGVIIVALQPSREELDSLVSQGQAVALLGGHSDGVGSVSVDNVGAGRAAVRHLLHLGHQRIAFIGIRDEEGSNLGGVPPLERLMGYREGLAEAGLDAGEDLVQFDENSVDGGAAAISRLLVTEVPPTAAFVASDEMAFGVLKILRQAGLEVPQDFSVLGFDNHELCDVVGLTTMDHDVAGQGQDAAQILLDTLHGEPPAATSRQTRLIIRESTAPPRTLRASFIDPGSSAPHPENH
ncbi:LacI family transcriptional regulator [Arthrobacter sp. BB-1]|uniref:LacI family DNA-binding transcriptional regulator n=1 Tax=unclassified Arthrobacter TaxID=235627 RepID=UPI001111EB38|nr:MULTISPECIES: LacI family DNA-binding transcriptional regulator [unclassified Arthrobacter]TNB75637.1 LacI family transcriptional regulator [Arthrobacter sp. BB-1]